MRGVPGHRSEDLALLPAVHGLGSEGGDSTVALVGGVTLEVRPEVAWGYSHYPMVRLAPGWERE
jgi:hypothetical protein